MPTERAHVDGYFYGGRPSGEVGPGAQKCTALDGSGCAGTAPDGRPGRVADQRRGRPRGALRRRSGPGSGRVRCVAPTAMPAAHARPVGAAPRGGRRGPDTSGLRHERATSSGLEQHLLVHVRLVGIALGEEQLGRGAAEELAGLRRTTAEGGCTLTLRGRAVPRVYALTCPCWRRSGPACAILLPPRAAGRLIARTGLSRVDVGDDRSARSQLDRPQALAESHARPRGAGCATAVFSLLVGPVRLPRRSRPCASLTVPQMKPDCGDGTRAPAVARREPGPMAVGPRPADRAPGTSPYRAPVAWGLPSGEPGAEILICESPPRSRLSGACAVASRRTGIACPRSSWA